MKIFRRWDKFIFIQFNLRFPKFSTFHFIKYSSSYIPPPKAAQLCFDNGFYNACANRAYYSMYHAAISILIASGFPPTQKHIDHGWVQSVFARELINRKKVFPGKFRRYLFDSQIIRNDADYDEASINQKTAKRQLNRGREFVASIKQEIRND